MKQRPAWAEGLFFWWWKCGVTVRAEKIASSLIQWIALYIFPPAGSSLQTVINQALLWLLKQGSTNLRAFFRSASLWTSVVWRMWLQVRAGKEQKHNVSIFWIHYVYCLTYLQYPDGRAEQNTDGRCFCMQSLLSCREKSDASSRC